MLLFLWGHHTIPKNVEEPIPIIVWKTYEIRFPRGSSSSAGLSVMDHAGHKIMNIKWQGSHLQV